MQRYTLYPLILVLLVFSQTGQLATRRIFFHSIDIAFNPVYFQDIRLDIQPNNASFDLIMNVVHTFKHNPWLLFTLGMKNRRTSRYRALFQTDSNVCQLVNNQGANFVKNFFQNFWNRGNMPMDCPIEQGNYSWSGLKADDFNVLQFFSGTYHLGMATYFRIKSNRVSLSNVSITAELK